MLEIHSETEEAALLDQINTRSVEVVGKLNKQLAHGGVVDEYLTDQMIIFMALASSGVGPSDIRGRDKVEDASERKSRCEILVGKVSSHTQAAMEIAEIMLPDIVFSTKTLENDNIIITCTKNNNFTC
jgi:RNA 3'-terminal phosphate cyclase